MGLIRSFKNRCQLQNFVEKIIGFRWVIILMVVALTGFLGYQIKNVTIDADIIGSLPNHDPDALLLKEISEEFGGNNMGIVILEAETIFDTKVLTDIRSITDTLTSIQGISSVTSLTNIINIEANEYGIGIGKLVGEDELPKTQESLDTLKKKVYANEMYRGSIISDDGKASLIIFTLSQDADVQFVAAAVRSKIGSLDLPESIYYTGSPMLVTYISDLMTSDLMRLLPIAFIVIAIILLLSFRSFRGVIFPLLTAVIAIVWNIGIMGLLGIPMSMISNNIPIILLAVGTAYTIHVINRVNQVMNSDQRSAIVLSLTFVMVPVILAGITTMIGFVSFIFGAYLSMIREFGIFTALGTFFACLLAIFFIPSVLSFLSYKNSDNLSKAKRRSFISEKMLEPMNRLLLKHPKNVLFIWIILIGVSITGIFFISRSVDIQEYFRKGDPMRLAEKIMIDKFGGTKPVFVLFKGNVQNPELLKTMVKAENYMKQSPDIEATQSVADIITEISGMISGERKIPDNQDQIEQLWFLLDGNEMMSRFVSEELDQAIILSRFRSPENENKKEFAAYMTKFINENKSADFTIQITGMPFVDITMDRSLVNSQLASLAIAILFVVVVVGLILRSFISGIYATLPIVAAIIILFGFMGLTGIPLNIGTVLVASVALGIGIDYSIHVISHFNQARNRTGNAIIAINEAIMISGKAIMINVLSVAGGFLVLIFSQMVPLQYFGLLIALSMVGSSLGALTLLPVILILVNRKK